MSAAGLPAWMVVRLLERRPPVLAAAIATEEPEGAPAEAGSPS
jgi:hypothetical protein